MIQVHTQIDRKVFTDFSNFNAFRLHYRGLGLAGFPVLMIALAILNYATGSKLFFWLFSLTGILLPLFYLLFYRVSLSKQIIANHLEQPRHAYSVQLDKTGVTVQNDAEHVVYRWDQVYRVYLREHYVYLYITKARAFLLPYTDIAEGADAQALISSIRQNLEPIRLFDQRSRALREHES